MKKLLYLFCASSLVLVSCSKDDDKSDAATSTLVKKVVYTDIDGSVETNQFTYDGNKIVSIVSSDGSKTNYTYTGNVITKIVNTDEKGILDSAYEYTYNNGKIATSSSIVEDLDNNYKTTYTHNADGTVSFSENKINKTTGEVIVGYSVGKYTFNGGNLIRNEYTTEGDKYLDTFDFDAKNNPLKNVTGMSLLLDDAEDVVSVNNIVKYTYSGTSDTCVFTYDENGFPTEVKGYNSDGKPDGNTKYFY
jgi:hypothetical protein